MSEDKKKRQKRSVYLIVENAKEFKSKKEAELYLASQTAAKPGVAVYQAKKVPFNVISVIHIG